MLALNDRVAIVTGAASGIGSAIAAAYIQEGALVLLVDRDGQRLLDALAWHGGPSDRANSFTADVSQPSQCQAIVDVCLERHGRVDILVNCAGMVEEVPFLEMKIASWDAMISTDLRSVFLCSRAAAPHMVRQGAGRIINIASQLGIKGGTDLAHYCAAKAGVIGFTKAVALELAPSGVLVNAIAPGPIETPLIKDLSADWKQQKMSQLPLRRFGLPSEVAPTAVLLASDPGGNLYVGQTLGPNGGDVMP